MVQIIHTQKSQPHWKISNYATLSIIIKCTMDDRSIQPILLCHRGIPAKLFKPWKRWTDCMKLVSKFTDTHLVTLYIEISFGFNKEKNYQWPTSYKLVLKDDGSLALTISARKVERKFSTEHEANYYIILAVIDAYLKVALNGLIVDGLWSTA